MTFLGSIPAARFLLGGSFTPLLPSQRWAWNLVYMVKTCFFLLPCPFPLLIQNNFFKCLGEGRVILMISIFTQNPFAFRWVITSHKRSQNPEPPQKTKQKPNINYLPKPPPKTSKNKQKTNQRLNDLWSRGEHTALRGWAAKMALPPRLVQRDEAPDNRRWCLLTPALVQSLLVKLDSISR